MPAAVIAIAALLGGCGGGDAAPAENTAAFLTPAGAVEAFVSASRQLDTARYAELFGADWRNYLPPVDEVGREEVDSFLVAYDRGHRINRTGERAILEVGDSGWTLPVPLVRGKGGWRFDLAAGAEEIAARRVGRNELAAIQAVLAYVDAQREYATRDWSGDGVLEYARRLVSTPGSHDGLIWPTDSAGESPLGPLYAQGPPGGGYHGYRYRILTAQGPAAPGGALDYLTGNQLTLGFGLVAWPTTYGESGVMTFIVNHDGRVFQRDLGPETASAVDSVTAYDPGPGWTAAEGG
jgi:hypothetical protein